MMASRSARGPGLVATIAFFVGIQSRSNVSSALSSNLRHFVNLGKACLVAGNSVATDTHGNLLLTVLGISLDLISARKSGDTKEKESDRDGS